MIPRSLAAATDAVAAALNNAGQACVLPGVLLRRLGLQDAAAAFVDASGLPFATMFGDKSVLGEDHPNYIGMYSGRLMEEPVRAFVESCDVVVMIGAMLTDGNTAGFTVTPGPGQDDHHRPSPHHRRLPRCIAMSRSPTFSRNCRGASPNVLSDRLSHRRRWDRS